MIEVQFLNKVLQSKDYSLIEDFDVTREHFPQFEKEFDYIVSHHNNYSNVPDTESFLTKFPKFPIVEVAEGRQYLVDTIREQELYRKLKPILKKASELFLDDSNLSADYIMANLDSFTPCYSIHAQDIIKETDSRFDHYLSRSEKKTFITTGYKELDQVINGWNKGEELVVIVARTGEGKSSFLIKTLTSAWNEGNNVGFLSPEMSGDRVGYRFDTAYKNFSNSSLIRGDDVDGYEEYISDLKNNQHKFMVSTPKDFGGRVTVTKIRQWAKYHKLDVIAIDGISYIRDERYNRGDTKTTSLTNIAEDLMALSIEMKVPILVAVQANRGGVKKSDEEGYPELQDIRDSDGIAYNASKAISIRQRDGAMEITPIKNRDGQSHKTLLYAWNPDRGQYNYIPSRDNGMDNANEEEVDGMKEKYGGIVF